MAYRSDLDALEARHAALENEVAEKERARDEAAAMLDEARERDRNDKIAADFFAGGPERRRRERIWIGVAVVVALAIVGGVTWVALRPYDGPFEQAKLELQQLADETCACKTSDCAQAVIYRIATWSNAHTSEIANFTKPQRDHLQTIASRYTRCAYEVIDTSGASQGGR